MVAQAQASPICNLDFLRWKNWIRRNNNKQSQLQQQMNKKEKEKLDWSGDFVVVCVASSECLCDRLFILELSRAIK